MKKNIFENVLGVIIGAFLGVYCLCELAYYGTDFNLQLELINDYGYITFISAVIVMWVIIVCSFYLLGQCMKKLIKTRKDKDNA